jgi:hypothetical protein
LTLRSCFLVFVCACNSSLPRLEAAISWQQTTPEVVECHYLKVDNPERFDIGRFTVDFPLGSHHVHVYRSDTPEPDHVANCTTGIDWQRWRLLVAAQTEPLDWRLPDGVAARIEPHQQLMVQVHWLNASQEPLHPTIHIGFEAADHPRHQLGALLAVSQDVALLPGEIKSVGAWVGLPEGARLVRAMGHYHRGRSYGVERLTAGGLGTSIYQSVGADAFTFASLLEEEPIGAGEGVDYRCDFENDSGGEVTWGPDVIRQEHCNLALYYFLEEGAVAAQVTVSGGLQRLVLTKDHGTILLARPTGAEGSDVQLRSSSPSVLEVPTRVHVPPWSDRAELTLDRHDEGSVRISATTGAETVEAIAE